MQCNCLNVCEDWCFVVMCYVLICYANRSDSFVQPTGYHSFQIKFYGSTCFRRIDTGAILIGDIVTTNHCLVLGETKG